MRKTLVALMVIAILMFAVACGKTEQQGANGEAGNAGNETAVETTSLTMSLGGTSGGFYITGAGLAKYVNDNTKALRLTPSTSGGGVENMRRVANGQADIGAVFTSDIWSAWKGEDPYNEPLQNFRIVGPALGTLGQHFTVLKKSGITTLDDLIGKTFVPGAPGSAATFGADLLLKEAGLYDKINIVYYNWEEISNLLKDGSIVGFNRIAAAPLGMVTEIAATHPVTLIDLEKTLAETNFFEKYPFWMPYEIPAGTYNGQEEAVNTYGMPSYWIVSKDLPDDVVYELAKLSYTDEAAKYLDAVYSGHDHGNKDPFKTLLAPLHPGAKKYWEEQGLEIPEPILE